MYEPAPDLYFYPGSKVMQNVPGLRDARALAKFEAAMTAQRSDEPLPPGRLSVSHYRNIHRHIFQDVYPWAGHYRTVRISKGNSHFCYPENIVGEMSGLFQGLARQIDLCRGSRPEFITTAAHFLSQLNAIHPFREGNGRTQTIFLVVLANRSDLAIDLQRLRPRHFLAAMVASFHGTGQKLMDEISRLICQDRGQTLKRSRQSGN